MEIQGLAYGTEPLKAALIEFDRSAIERQRLWDTVESNEDMAGAEEADRLALERVQEAFYQVTKDRNSRDDCRRVDMTFMRQIAARY